MERDEESVEGGGLRKVECYPELGTCMLEEKVPGEINQSGGGAITDFNPDNLLPVGKKRKRRGRSVKGKKRGGSRKRKRSSTTGQIGSGRKRRRRSATGGKKKKGHRKKRSSQLGGGSRSGRRGSKNPKRIKQRGAGRRKKK